MTDPLNQHAKPDTDVRKHYEAGLGEQGLLPRLRTQLARLGEGQEVERQLAAFDHFHVRGKAATAELAALAGVRPGLRVLDAGSGLGGPSRYLAAERGCEVVGVDLSPAFVEVAAWLAERAGVEGILAYRVADLTALPFPDGSFDLVWSEHVMMNLAERTTGYRSINRVLKPGGLFAFYEPYALEQSDPPHYPLPWAASASASHLLTREATADSMAAAGLALVEWRDVSKAASAAFANQPPPDPNAFGLGLAMGPRFSEMAMNFARNVIEGRLGLVMGIARKH